MASLFKLGEAMDTQAFLGRVLGDEGYYCVLAIKNGQKMQKFYPTITAAQDAAEQFDQNGYDAYYALGTFREAGSRKVQNVNKLKAFFLDLDCGPTKDYPDQATALKALRAFCQRTALPRPLIVNSGRGVHVYWALAAPVPLETWAPAAERLKALCKEQGFACDHNVTADAARVLRVPGTRNYKDDPPRWVAVLGAGDAPAAVELASFEALLPAIPVLPKFTPRTAELDPVTRTLLSNKENKFKDILVKTSQGRGCAQLAYIIREQATMSEPLWRAGLSIAKFCSDGDKAAVLLSRNHPEFSEDEMYDKMDRIKGPYLCSTFDEYNPGVCTECPLWGKIKSPIVLGSTTKEATDEDNVVDVGGPEPVLIPKLPRPYFRGANGGVYLRTLSDDGDPEDVCIYSEDIYITRRLHDPELGECLVFRHHHPRDGIKNFTVPVLDATSREEFRKHMSKNGLFIIGKDIDRLMTYVRSWHEEIRNNMDADSAHRQFGWTGDGFESFVLGHNVYHPSGRVETNPATKATAGLMNTFEPKGTLDGWKATMAFFNKPNMELHQFVALMAFGSVLVQMSAVNCAAIHLYSKDSGYGKTTAMHVAASAFGRPGDLVLHAKDTGNSSMNRSEVYRSLLLAVDEVTNLQGKALSDMAYDLTGGKQRNRLARSGNVERVRGKEWKLLAVTTGNTSIINTIWNAKAAPKAEAQRILEVRVDRVFSGHMDKDATDKFAMSVGDHYGHAGPLFVQWVMDHEDEVREIYARVQKNVDEQAALGPENRFWSVLVSSTIAAGIICKRLGFVHYDMPSIFKFMVQVLRDAKKVVSSMTTPVETLLIEYITENWNNMLRIKSTDDLRKNGANNNGLDTLVVPEAQPRGQLVARYETDAKKLYLLPKPFRTWCVEQQIDHGAVLQELKTSMNARRVKMRLGKGTNLSLPPMDVICIDMFLGAADEEEPLDLA